MKRSGIWLAYAGVALALGVGGLAAAAGNPVEERQTIMKGVGQSMKEATGYASGQTAWDVGRRILGGRDLAAQARHALENLRLAMRACGGDLSDVVSLRIYVVGDPSEPAKAAAVGDALREVFPEDARPASTWIGVAALARPEFLIEIEAMGVLD